MKPLTVVILTVLAVLGLAQLPAHADDVVQPPYVQPPYVCGPTQMPSQVPCDQLPTTTTTTVPFKYCLGYPQQFPHDQPCPKPPDTSCQLHPDLFECHDPGRTAPVAPVVGGTVPPTTVPEAATTTTEPAQVSSITVVPQTQHRATQRPSGPPRTHKRVATTTTTLPPLYFVLGQWLTYDEFAAYLDVMGP